MELLPTSQLLALPLQHLKAALGEKAHVYVAQTYRHALEGLFAGPHGFLVILALGDETPESDSLAGEGFEEVQILRDAITVTVAAPILPTAAPSEGIYQTVAGAEPFLDVLQRVKTEMLAMRLPAGSTGVYWEYKGRKAVEVEGLPFPAYTFTFEMLLSPDERAEIADPTQDLWPDPADLPPDLPILGENPADLPSVGETENDLTEP